MVDFDSTILPGRVGHVTQSVKLKGYSGPVHKSVTVTSNASNEPTLRLNITVNVEPIVGVDQRYVQLKDADFAIELTSRKKDLVVTDVVFEPSGSETPPGAGSAWQQNLPEPISFDFAPSTAAKKDGRSAFILTLHRPAKHVQNSHGKFVIKTNHPTKAEIKVRGSILHDQ